MSRVIHSLAIVVLVGISTGSAFGQGKLKDLESTHALDLASRKFGEAEFTASTQKIGVEGLRDLNNGFGMYVTERAAIGLAPGFENTPLTVKAPVWITGLDLPARKAGEKEFTKTTRTYCLEIFRDPNTDNILYITSDGVLAAVPKGKLLANNASPEWVHSVDLNVRKAGVKEFTDANKIGIEIYRDGNTGNLIYISHTGSIAAVSEVGETKANDKAPSSLHGLDLSIRRANEQTFTKETRKVGVEVFRDETNGNLIYVTEAGALAVVPGGEKLTAPTPNFKEPTWSHGWNVKVRRSGEKAFSERTQTFGGEVFRDENVGVLIAICDSGAISAIRVK